MKKFYLPFKKLQFDVEVAKKNLKCYLLSMYLDTKKMKYISAALFPDTAQRYNHYVSEDIQLYFAFAFREDYF